MIALHVLGGIALRGDDGAAVDALLRQPKRLALLAYLAAPEPGTWHRRDMLLALFWPELDTAHARTSLRNALYVIRQRLGERVVRTRGDEEISLDPDLLRTDLADVWRALRDGRVDDALTACRGELLPGLFPPESDGFMRWLDGERTRLRVAVATAGAARAAELEGAGNLAAALAVARRVAAIQPDDETAVRRLIALHEALGDRAGGLAAYESFRTRLASEFEAEPAPETTALATRLRAPASPPPPFAPPARRDVPRASPVPAVPDTPPRGAASVESGPAHRRWLLASALGVAALAAAGTLGWRALRPARPQAIGASAPVTADDGLQVEAAMSPDGRLVAYAKGDPASLRIHVQRVGGGEPWRLTTDTATAELMPRWSPDNDAVLFLSRDGAWVAPAVGGAPRLVARGTPGEGKVRSASWSPAGDSVAIVRNDSLLVVPVVGRGARAVATAPRRQLHSCAWKGAWIACVAGNWVSLEPGPLFGNEAPSAIVLFAASGKGAPIDLTGNAFQHRSPAWSADGRFLWMLSNRDGAPGEAYAVPIGADGRASGSFVRVGLSAESIDLAAGRMAYSVPVRRANVWAVPVPGEAPTSLSRAGIRVTSGTQLTEVVYASGDRKWLVYDSNVSGNADLFRIPVGGGVAERLTDDPRPEYCGVVSPDGRELAWHRWVNGERRVFVKRLDGDAEQEVYPEGGEQAVPRWSPDGRALVTWSRPQGAEAIVVLRRDDRGVWKRAWRLAGGRLANWAPDGRALAFMLGARGIAVIPADSGAARTIYTPRPGSDDPIVSNLVWLDEATIWFLGDSRGQGGIWSVPAAGGTPRLRVLLDDAAGRTHGPVLTSDGKRFYFTLDERFANVRWAELLPR